MRRALLITVLLLTAGVMSAPAAEAKEVSNSARAEEVLRGMCDYIKSLKSFSFTHDYKMKMTAEGMQNAMETKFSAAIEQPDKIAYVAESGMMGATIISDGEHLTTYLPMRQVYTVEEAPETLSGISMLSMMDVSSGGFASALVDADPYHNFMAGVTQSVYVAKVELDGVSCHHLKFMQEPIDWELWVDAGVKPLPRRIVPDMEKAMKSAGGHMPMKDMKIEVSATFSDWQTNIEIPAERFVFHPPEGATKEDSLFGDMSGGEEQHDLLGKPAPEFALDTLEGKSVNLKDYLGENTVILDFWATWCGPCVRALPQVAKAAAKYKDQGVVFFAVNQREDAESITSFLEDKGLDVTVLLDSDGAVGDLYGVTGIPQTVIIGRDGTVQVVHVGAMPAPGLEDQISSDIEDLLAGKNLAGEAGMPDEESGE